MTKQELGDYLKAGYFMGDAFDFRFGQGCEIYKAKQFQTGDEIIYIPDVQLNEIPMDAPITDEELIDEVVDKCYTGNDFIKECDGDRGKAERLFWYCDWQHPSSALDEGAVDDDDEMEIKKFAATEWSLGDVVAVAANKGIQMTSAQAAEWWGRNEPCFVNRMVEYGNKTLAEIFEEDKDKESSERNT